MGRKRKKKQRQRRTTSPPAPRPQAKSASPGRTGLIAGAVVAVLVLAVAGYAFLGRGSQPAPEVAQQQGEVDATVEALASLPIAPRIGARAPDFTLNDTTGTPVSLSDFRGQPVVVTFFHTW